jgi:hypothetical protein
VLIRPNYALFGAAAPIGPQNVYSVDLDGASQRIEGLATELGPGALLGAWTIQFWMREDVRAVNTGLFSWWDSASTLRQSTLIYMPTATRIGVLVRTSSAVAGVQWDLNSTAGDWAHIAITNDGISSHTSRFRLYEDTADRGNGITLLTGAPVGQQDISGTGQKPMYGARQSGASFFWLNGKLDDKRIHNAVLSGSQIAAEWKSSLVGNETNLQHLLRAEQNANDSGPNGWDFSEVGGPLAYSTDVPWTI